MKILFVHRLLPDLGNFDPRAYGFDGPRENIWHVSRSFQVNAVRGLDFGRVVFVDILPNELSVERIRAITAALAAGSQMARAEAEKTTGLDFGDAVRALKAGKRVARAGWNGKGMHLELQVPDAHSKMSLPYIFMLTACGNRVPWLASQTDVLGEDWEIVADAEAAPVGPWHKPLPPELDPNTIVAGTISADKFLTREPDPLVEGAEIAVRNVRVGDITGTRMTVFSDVEVGPEAAQALRLIFAGQPA